MTNEAIEREWRTRCDAAIAANLGDVPQPVIARYGGQVPAWVTRWYRYHTEEDGEPVAPKPAVAPQVDKPAAPRKPKHVKQTPEEAAESNRRSQRVWRAKQSKEWQRERNRKQAEALKAKYTPEEMRERWRQQRRNAKARGAAA